MIRLALGAVLLGLLFWGWYLWVADYGYAAISGTYVFRNDGQYSTLVLSKNRVFHQELSSSGNVQRAEGTWRREGEGGVCFSKEFLKAAGQRERPDGQADGQVEKSFSGLFTSIVFNGDKGSRVFHKELFR
jgi:hypothetical protein